ncbi:MAG: DNA-directed RNA polymerase subunit beta [Proteobacteria bacterium]|nr:DNA-directed RNA polymerase subunit beta [Pseudomonadota bacterium]
MVAEPQVFDVALGKPSAVGRMQFGSSRELLEMPNLLEIQKKSFEWFKRDGLRELFDEISPITDFTGKNLELRLWVDSDPFGDPKFDEDYCRERDLTFGAALNCKAELRNKNSGEIKESQIFMGDFPMMTEHGTFIINGAERVVVSQLVRSPGVYFDREFDGATARYLYTAKLIPSRGAWLEFETSNKGMLTVKIDRKRKIPVTTLLRSLSSDYADDEAIYALFEDVDTDPDHQFIASTIGTTTRRDPSRDYKDAVIEIYRRLRPGDPATMSNAETTVHGLFFNSRRYDLGRVGRYKLNRRLRSFGRTDRTLDVNDLVAVVRELIRLNRDQDRPDDIDHLGNRRIRAVGELIQNQFRVGLLRMERVIKERMTIQDPDSATPKELVNIRPVVAAMKEFFGGSQLSQFMDQTNPLSEVTHKRRLSALGPGGLSRDRAGLEVRDVHESHYGRICPIETPEGPNIGLIGSLATFGRINDYGFIETPYRAVHRTVSITANTDPHELVGRQIAVDARGRVPSAVASIFESSTVAPLVSIVASRPIEVDATLASALVASASDHGDFELPVRSYVKGADDIRYLAADEEEVYYIAQANTEIDGNGNIVQSTVVVRHVGEFETAPAERVNLLDVSPKQFVSVAAALIPFVEHDDANRALMGANMQRQAVPLLRPEAPLVATGVEFQVAKDSGQVAIAKATGEVVSATATEVVVVDHDGQPHRHALRKFVRSNQGTCINQRPIVSKGDHVVAGQPIADSMSTDGGELALGQNVLCAFMFWEGGNFEDAILLSKRLVQDDRFTSIHIEKYEVEARDTKLGQEEITRDIPNVGEDALRHLDDDGIIYVGAEVRAGDILVGKITPKGETELTAEERLLRAIFGEKAREVKDTSLRVPSGEYGKVVDVKKFKRDDAGAGELPAGVHEMVRVSIAVKRKLTEGDKMAGRHGNKGVIAKVMPVEDMPYLEDGTPVDIILSPLGAPSRMNIGSILETHLGWAASALGIKVASPVFDSAKESQIEDLLQEAKNVALAAQEGEDVGRPSVFNPNGKARLYDGRTGDAFDQDVCVGYIYMLKLAHLVEDKIHARSTGPYSLITQQPLGGKAQFGGQRFGEMEVWALEAYGAAHILQELLTVKSDDIVGRVKTYEAIVKGEPIMEPGVPESFKVLMKELHSLGLAVEVLNENEEEIPLIDDSGGDSLPELGINLEGFEDRD